MEAIGTDMTSRLFAMNVIFVAMVAQLNFVTGIGNTAIEAVAAADTFAGHPSILNRRYD
jgi:hypothetical protein